MLQINQKIVGWHVIHQESAAQEENDEVFEPAPPIAVPTVARDVDPDRSTQENIPSAPALRIIKQNPADVIHDINERMDRPESLYGRTYKIKAPVLDYSLYVTINDIVLNEGTEFETRRPFEVFVNSKNMESFQWIVALTRVMSAVFRKGGDVSFLIDELKVIFDPRGGYFKPGGVYMPSVVAEIGNVLERHLAKNAKIYERKQTQQRHEESASVNEQPAAVQEAPSVVEGSVFPPSASLCTKCMAKSVMILDGCQTCLNCGYSKCG